jgi:hypothetical protein
MKGNAVAIAVGAAVLLAGLALGFVAGRRSADAPTDKGAQAAPAPEAPAPEIAEALVGKWRLRTVNGTPHNELLSK